MSRNMPFYAEIPVGGTSAHRRNDQPCGNRAGRPVNFSHRHVVTPGYIAPIRRLPLVAVIALAACGGGGDAGPAPAPTSQPTQGCAPRPVVVQFFGDSTQEQQKGNLQIALDMALGPGVAVVKNLGVSGTTAADFPAAKVKAGAVTVVNYGINDSRAPGATLEAYQARLRAISPTVFETPSPPFDGYAQAMRHVAAELGRPVIDVSAQVRAMPGWEGRVWDGVHPDPGLYGIIARDIVAPALAAEVRKRLCAS